jgi:hypothetical protein
MRAKKPKISHYGLNEEGRGRTKKGKKPQHNVKKYIV